MVTFSFHIVCSSESCSYKDSCVSSSFNVTPPSFFQLAGPLILYPVTKSASAEELEKIISSVVVKSLTFPASKYFFRIVAAPLLNDFSEVFSLTVEPANKTKPSVVITPVALTS